MEKPATPLPNIHVGKSWPRPATPSNMVPKWEGEFSSHSDWVNFASKRLTVATSLVTGAQVPAICVDAFGRRCTCGGDFARARDEGAFPVRYFFECEEPTTPDLTAINAELVDLLSEAADDIEATVKHQWGYDERLKRQYDRDMDIVVRARTALARARAKENPNAG